MNVEKGAIAGVVATGPITALVASVPIALISVTLGVIGVIVARTIFVNRENRKYRRKQRFRETFPLTLAAGLIAIVVISEYKLPFTFSLLTGLGVGMSIIAIMDVIGTGAREMIRRLVLSASAFVNAPPPPRHPDDIDRSPIPDDQKQLLRKIEEVDQERE